MWGLPLPLGVSQPYPVEFSFAGQYKLRRGGGGYQPSRPENAGSDLIIYKVEFGFDARFTLLRYLPPPPLLPPPPELLVPVTFGFPGIFRLERDRTFAFPSERLPATRIITARRDEDELLTLL